MWSGAPQWASWALQPQHYQNMNHEEVDWAELAKQWINMKENTDTPNSQPQFPMQQAPPPPPPLPAAPVKQHFPQPQIPPPPPPATNFPHDLGLHPPGEVRTVERGIDVSTGGAMDMEIEDEKDVQIHDQSHNNGENWQDWHGNTTSDWEGRSQMQANWGYGWPMDTNRISSGGHSQPDMPTEQIPTMKDVSNTNYLPYSKSFSGHDTFSGYRGESLNSENYQGSSYSWDAPGISSSGVMMQKVVDYGHRDRRKHCPQEIYSGNNDVKENEFQLDAAQRKRLPLWIREGLEKMEREKQRKLEKDRMHSTQQEMLRQQREVEENARNALQESLNNDGIPRAPVKSKFESDSEDSDHTPPTQSPLLTKRSRFHQSDSHSPKSTPGETEYEEKPSEGLQQIKSEEDKVADMMLKLRRWMTEILLDVTTLMISEVSTEVFNKAKMRVPQVKNSSALASLSGGLGLGIYSDSESDSAAEEGASYRTSGGLSAASDSDEELQRTIRRKRRDFEDIEREILQHLQQEEEEKLANQRALHDSSLAKEETEDEDEDKVPPSNTSSLREEDCSDAPDVATQSNSSSASEKTESENSNTTSDQNFKEIKSSTPSQESNNNTEVETNDSEVDSVESKSESSEEERRRRKKRKKKDRRRESFDERESRSHHKSKKKKRKRSMSRDRSHSRRKSRSISRSDKMSRRSSHHSSRSYRSRPRSQPRHRRRSKSRSRSSHRRSRHMSARSPYRRSHRRSRSHQRSSRGDFISSRSRSSSRHRWSRRHSRSVGRSRRRSSS